MVQGVTKLLCKSTSKQNFVQRGRANDFNFWHIKKLSKRDVKTTTFFCLSESNRNMHVEVGSVFNQYSIKKIHRNNVNFWSIEIMSKKYVEAMLIFRPSKLCRLKCVESTFIFCPSNLHWKITSKWREIHQHFHFKVSM